MNACRTRTLSSAPKVELPVRKRAGKAPARFALARATLPIRVARKPPLGEHDEASMPEVIGGRPDAARRWGVVDGPFAPGATMISRIVGQPVGGAIDAPACGDERRTGRDRVSGLLAAGLGDHPRLPPVPVWRGLAGQGPNPDRQSEDHHRYTQTAQGQRPGAGRVSLSRRGPPTRG